MTRLTQPQVCAFHRAGTSMSAGVNLFLEADDVDALGMFDNVPPEAMGELLEEVSE